ncbi:MAG: hypothetical protein AABX61_02515 [Nanoarchaeota archaeon]
MKNLEKELSNESSSDRFRGFLRSMEYVFKQYGFNFYDYKLESINNLPIKEDKNLANHSYKSLIRQRKVI